MSKPKNLIRNWPTFFYYGQNSYCKERALQSHKVPELVHKALPKEQDWRGMHYYGRGQQACNR